MKRIRREVAKVKGKQGKVAGKGWFCGGHVLPVGVRKCNRCRRVLIVEQEKEGRG